MKEKAMENTLVQKFNIKYSEMDHNLALKPYSLLNFLQDIASESAEKLGFGYSFMSKRNLGWFLIKYRMEFIDYPVGIYEITIKTRPRGYNKLFAYRDFEIYSNEKLLGRIFSVWSIINFETKTTMPIANVILDNPCMQQYQKSDNDLSFSKIKPLDEVSNKKEFIVRYNDLDVNKHANNGNYIIWAFETLSLDFKTTHKIKTLDMMFKKEAKFDENIISEVQINENITSHKISNANSEDVCLIQCEWE